MIEGDNINKLKLISLNVRGLTDHFRRRKCFTWIRDTKAENVTLQETFCTKSNQRFFDASWGGKVHHSLTESSHSRGLAIMFSSKFK